MKRFEKQQHSEQGNELWIEVIPEDGEGQTGFSERIPKALHQVLELRRTQSSEENLKHME